MQPDYKTNDPRGWGGDPKRGAALGRPSIHSGSRDARDLSDWEGKLRVCRVRLNAGGYDSNGTYFGIGQSLYWAASDDCEIDYMLRSPDRATAKRKVSERYPRATFYR